MTVLFVDDIREPSKMLKSHTILIAKDYESAIEILKTHNIDAIDLDHDLGEEKTGYDICKYIIEKDIHIPEILIHTSNSVGRQNMVQLLKHNTTSRILSYSV